MKEKTYISKKVTKQHVQDNFGFEKKLYLRKKTGGTGTKILPGFVSKQWHFRSLLYFLLCSFSVFHKFSTINKCCFC